MEGLGRQLSQQSLPYKCEDLNSIPGTHIKRPGVVACTCNPTAKDVETGRSMDLTGQPGYLIVKLQANK